MSNIQFNIQRTFALSPGLETTEEWTYWSRDHQWPDTLLTPTSSAIPAMIRRRMSAISKLAVQVACELSQHETIDFVVFSSRHGELQRTVKLLQEIQLGETASPIAFSQSVHSTAAGLFTIVTKQPIPASSISASEDTFHCALTEAAIFLNQYPDSQVMVVDFDAPLPTPYEKYDSQQFESYALGLLLKQGDDITLQRSPNTHSQHEQSLPQALAFYSQWLAGTLSFEIPSIRQKWRWHRKIQNNETNAQ